MTDNGRKTLQVMESLSENGRSSWLTAGDITEKFDGLPDRLTPVMTVSSYLTHLQRGGLVERSASSDRATSWWRVTGKGKRELRKFKSQDA